MKPRLYGIRLHVALLTLIPLLVMAVGFGSFFLNDRFAEMDRELLARGQLIARQLAASSEYGVFSNNRMFLANLAKSALLEVDVKAVTVLNAAKEVLVASGEMRPQTDRLLRTLHRDNRIIDNGTELAVYEPLLTTQIAIEESEHASQQIGAVILVMSWQRTNQLKSGLLRLTVAATAVFLLTTFYLIYLASRHTVESIRNLSKAVTAIGAGALNTRVTDSSQVSELDALGSGINQMAADLQHERAILQQRIDEATVQLRGLAFYDTLTQLPNRRLLYDRLIQTMAANKRTGSYGALMFLDLDNFKSLNDRHGHEVGDLLLIEAANRMKRCVREMDTVARFGGDEFLVMISELDGDHSNSASEAEVVAEKIRNALSEVYVLTIRHEGKADTIVEHHCTASIGVALFVNHAGDPDDLIQWADAAMYQAKEFGRNSIRFYESMT